MTKEPQNKWEALHAVAPNWLWLLEFVAGAALILGLFFAPMLLRAVL